MKSLSNVAGFLAALSMLGFSAQAGAAEWYQGPQHTRFPGKPEAAATAYLKSFSQELALQRVDLRQTDVLQLRSLRTVRFEQRYQGLPVFGSIVAVRVAPDGTVLTTAMDVARSLTVSPIPSVSEPSAVAVVAGALGHPVGAYQAELGVRPQNDVGGILVWHVDVMHGRGMHRFVVDAHGGRLMFSYPMSSRALGRVYAVNENKTPTLIDAELIGLNAADPSRLDGFDNGLKVFGYKSGDVTYSNITVTHATAPNTGTDFLYEPNYDTSSLDDPFGEVMAYYHAARMRSYFEDTFGLNMTGNQYSLAVVSSYAPATSPKHIENAFYTPWYKQYYGDALGDTRNAIFLGRGYSVDLAYDSDVLLHEYTHYISNNAMKYSGMGMYDQYGYLSMPRAINEGTADYFSSTVNDDPVVGEVALPQYARDLTAPVGRCPENVIGEEHYDGTLIGTTGWAVRKAFGAETADQLMWGAMSLLGGGAALGDLGDGLLQSATDLGLDASQLQTIQEILAARGLDECGRAIPLHDGQTRTTYITGLESVGEDYGYSCSDLQGAGYFTTSIFQFEVAAKGTEDGVRIDVDLDTEGGGKLDWDLYVRRGEMITLSGYQGYDAPVVSGFDYVVENISENHGEIVLDDTSNPAFDPTGTYYAMVVTSQCSMASARLKATPLDATVPGDAGTDAPYADAGTDAPAPHDGGPGYDAKPPTSDGGTGSETGTNLQANPDPLDIGGGCGCRVPAAPAKDGLAAGLVALAAALLLRRKRSNSLRQ